MGTDKEMRLERIDRLLHELRYEVERGFMEDEIDERMGFQFIVPVSRQIKDGVVWCSFETRPIHRGSVIGRGLCLEPKLKLVVSQRDKTTKVDED